MLRAAAYRQVVIGRVAAAQHVVGPVGRRGPGDLFGREYGRPAPVVGQAAVGVLLVVVEVILFAVYVCDVHVLLCVEHVEVLVIAREGIAAFIADPGSALGAFFRRDEDHAVGGPDAVDGRRSVFQHFDRLDVRGVETRQAGAVDVARKPRCAAQPDGVRRHDDAVDDVNRVACTADRDVHLTVGLRTVDRGLETCGASQQHLRDVAVRGFRHVVGLHLRDGRGQVAA